ncbi:MAG: hypothetical protein ACRCYE_11530 [Sarcina sp.]
MMNKNTLIKKSWEEAVPYSNEDFIIINDSYGLKYNEEGELLVFDLNNKDTEILLSNTTAYDILANSSDIVALLKSKGEIYSIFLSEENIKGLVHNMTFDDIQVINEFINRRIDSKNLPDECIGKNFDLNKSVEVKIDNEMKIKFSQNKANRIIIVLADAMNNIEVNIDIRDLANNLYEDNYDVAMMLIRQYLAYAYVLKYGFSRVNEDKLSMFFDFTKLQEELNVDTVVIKEKICDSLKDQLA